MAVGQNQWYHFGIESTTHFRNYFHGAWDVHWGYVIWTHGQMGLRQNRLTSKLVVFVLISLEKTHTPSGPPKKHTPNVWRQNGGS